MTDARLHRYTLVKGKNTLLVTDNCPIKEAVMINFSPSEKEEVVRFETSLRLMADFLQNPPYLMNGQIKYLE